MQSARPRANSVGMYRTNQTLRISSPNLISLFSHLPYASSTTLPAAMAPHSRIYLTRHAQAEHNVDLDYTSASPLNPPPQLPPLTNIQSSTPP